MLARFDQRPDDDAAEYHARQDHQDDGQAHGARHGDQCQVQVLPGLRGRVGLRGLDVLGELFDGIDEGGATGRAVFRVDHIEGAVVLAAQRLYHGVDAVVDVGAVAAHQVHGQLAAGVVFQHVLLEVAEVIAHFREQVVGRLQRVGRVLLGGRRGFGRYVGRAGFLQIARRYQQRDTRAQHVGVDDLYLRGAIGQGAQFDHRAVVLVQEKGRHAAHRHDQQGEDGQDEHQHRADARIAHRELALDLGCTARLALAGLGLTARICDGFHEALQTRN
ncbi:NAD-specific glutamate dehydrogenase [Bordetella bronchialis]